jgi:hypothetical protein
VLPEAPVSRGKHQPTPDAVRQCAAAGWSAQDVAPDNVVGRAASGVAVAVGKGQKVIAKRNFPSVVVVGIPAGSSHDRVRPILLRSLDPQWTSDFFPVADNDVGISAVNAVPLEPRQPFGPCSV